MSSTIKNQYEPDYVSLPGDTLSEVLADRQMKQSEFAKRVGLTPKHINEVIKGKMSITPETALTFERVLGIPCSFWNNRQRIFDTYLARREEMEKISKNLNWASQFPYKQMSKLGWLQSERDELKQFANLLNFFGVATPDAWSSIWQATQVAYRKPISKSTDQYSLFAWLRRGEIEAQSINCEDYDESRFKESLVKIRSLTLHEPEHFQKELINICAECGVAVVFVQELPRTASGATRWLSPTKALLQLSLRYKRDDSLWFTFFHEAAHIILHQKKMTFLEGLNVESEQESEANKFAADYLITPNQYKDFLNATNRLSKAAIKEFALDIGVAAGIIVGRLQHDNKLPPSHCNELKRKLRWAS